MRTLPDFEGIEEPSARKSAFVDWLSPQVEAANVSIGRDRSHLAQFRQRLEEMSTAEAVADDRLLILGARYRLPLPEDPSAMTEWLDEMLLRVDRVPVPLALAQAALESGWGTSRLARLGNNLFGLRCFTPGCGLIPQDLQPGDRHRYQAFVCPSRGLAAYLLNLNSHPAYADLRAERGAIRAEGREPAALELIPTLTRYAEDPDLYLARLRSLVVDNGWEPEIPDPAEAPEATD